MFLAPKALTNVDKHSKQWAMCQLQLYWVYMTMQRSFFLGSHLPFLPLEVYGSYFYIDESEKME
jgi:hypothetical protein